jgi:cell wall assembly regulator SMI1
MVICDVCGQVYDSMKTKHVCPGPPDLDRPATMKDIQKLPKNLGFNTPAFMRGFFLLTDWDYNPSVVRP